MRFSGLDSGMSQEEQLIGRAECLEHPERMNLNRGGGSGEAAPPDRATDNVFYPERASPTRRMLVMARSWHAKTRRTRRMNWYVSTPPRPWSTSSASMFGADCVVETTACRRLCRQYADVG